MIGDKVALIADVHIGVNKNSEEFFEIAENWFKYFVKDIESKGIKHVILLGDLYHYRDEITLTAMDVASKILELFPKNIHIHILTGNHDCYFKDNSEIHSLRSFNSWENITVYDKTTIEKVGSNKIAIIPWGEEPVSEKCDYVFGHFEINNFRMNDYAICSDGIDSKDILKSNATVYTGHFHKKQTKKYKSGSITYVGSPYQQDFNDVDNENGYHILDFDTGDCEFIPNGDKFPQFKHIKITNIKDFDFNTITNNFVKLIIDKEVKESGLEKLMIKINSEKPRRLVVDDITVKKDIDNLDLSANIGAINIGKSIDEFVDKMGDIPHKEETLKRMKYYYEKKTT